MRLTLPTLAAVLTMAACGSTKATNSGPVAITEPTIWLKASPSIDPTALPLLDQHYDKDTPKRGYVYVCEPKMFQQTNGPGSSQDGPWINKAAGTYDVTKKLFFQGSVFYSNAELTIATMGDRRSIVANGFPFGVQTGVFPVPSTDPGYQYDRNPNAVTTQAISFSVPRNPTVASSPSCVYKTVGIALDGVQLHCALDSSGRDEIAYQLQDVCSGASQPGGGYHRHALSECTPHIHEKTALVGYALDGFGIFSPYDANGKELTTADLDECHGVTSEIDWEGTTVSMYHYVMTRDFPYTVSCFKGTPTRNAFPALPGAPPEH